MNSEILKGNWEQLKGEVRKTWGKITDSEVQKMEGNYDALVGKLRERYGYTLEDTQTKVNAFLEGLQRQVDKK